MNLASFPSTPFRLTKTRRFGPGRWVGFLLSAPLALVLLAPRSAWACAACYGQSDSAMAAGMNWGILSLLGIIVFVLGGVAGFFVFLARRTVKMAATQAELLPRPAASAAPVVEDSTPPALEPVLARGGLGQTSTLARRRAKCAQTASRARH